jgi:hypothetical protein
VQAGGRGLGASVVVPPWVMTSRGCTVPADRSYRYTTPASSAVALALLGLDEVIVLAHIAQVVAVADVAADPLAAAAAARSTAASSSGSVTAGAALATASTAAARGWPDSGVPSPSRMTGFTLRPHLPNSSARRLEEHDQFLADVVKLELGDGAEAPDRDTEQQNRDDDRTRT